MKYFNFWRSLNKKKVNYIYELRLQRPALESYDLVAVHRETYMLDVQFTTDSV